MTRRASSSLTPGSSHPKFMVGWFFGTFLHVVPITDHEPSYLNVTRTSALSGVVQLNVRFASLPWLSFFQPSANRLTSSFCWGVPSMNPTEMVGLGVGHLESLTSAAFFSASDTRGS